MKTVYSSLTGRSGDRSVIECSLQLNRRFGSLVDFFHVRLDPATISELAKTTPFTASYLINEQLVLMASDASERANHARKTFDEFLKTQDTKSANGDSAAAFGWTEVTGIDTDQTIERARPYDLVFWAVTLKCILAAAIGRVRS